MSDIHYNPESDGVSTHTARTELPKYLASKKINADYLFVTGDFRHAAYQSGNEQQHAEEAVDYVIKIAEAANVSADNIYYVSGNHDLSRFSNDDDKARLREISKNYDHLQGKIAQEEYDFLFSRFSYFGYIREEFSKRGVIDYWNKNIHNYHSLDEFDLLSINTCLFCDSDNDRGNLILGTYDIMKILEEKRANSIEKPLVVLAHHSLNLLIGSEKKQFLSLCKDMNVTYLCGDAHLIDVQEYNNVYEFTSGCMVASNGVQTTVNCIELTSGIKPVVVAHSWDTHLLTWDEYSHFNNQVNPRQKAQPVTHIRPKRQENGFIPRTKEICEILSIFKNSNVLSVTSMGGMGKTQLCSSIFYACLNADFSVNISKIGWINFEGNDIKESCYKKFPDISATTISIEDYWEELKNRHLNNRCMLLIIDNADKLSTEDVELLEQLDCKILINSRFKNTQIQSYVLDTLSDEDCLQLYRFHSKDTSGADDVLLKIIGLANKHTLTVELLAKTQYACCKTANGLYKELVTTGFQLPNIEEYVEHRGENVFIEHLVKVFAISSLSDEQKKLLHKFTYIRANEEISATCLKNIFELKNMNEVNNLEKSGWINRAEGNSFVIHPIVSATASYVLKSNKEILNQLANNSVKYLLSEPCEENIFETRLSSHLESLLLNYVKLDYYDSEHLFDLSCKLMSINIIQEQYKKAGELLSVLLKSFDKLGLKESKLEDEFFYIAQLFSELGNYSVALKLFELECVSLMENQPENNRSIAMMFNVIGLTYFKLGNYHEAISYYNRAYEIQEKLFIPESFEASVTYNNLGMAYLKLGYIPQASENLQTALDIRKNKPAGLECAVATSYNNFGLLHNQTGDHSLALSFFKKALKLRKVHSGETSIIVAETYCNLAQAYLYIKSSPIVLKHLDLALKILEEKLGSKHHKIAMVYNAKALYYMKKNMHSKAVECFEMALDMFCNTLGDKHPDTCVVYVNLGDTCYILHDYVKALKYFKLAYPILVDTHRGETQETEHVRIMIRDIEEKLNSL